MLNELSDLSIFDEWEKGLIRKNWVDFKEILLKNEIDCFHHVTDQSNIDSIESNGLCSLKYCINNGIKINCYGSSSVSREIDKHKGTDNYVKLYLFKNDPQIYKYIQQRIPDPCILHIDSRIVYLKTTIFSNINSTDNNAIIGNDINNFNKINFQLLKDNNLYDKKLLQAEILIRTWVPCKFIRNLKIYG